MTLASGESFITSAAGGTGLNSADLMLGGLTPTNDATVNFMTTGGANIASGLIGSSNRVEIAGMTTTDNIIGPWAISSRDFASYILGLGVGALNQTGFPGYSNTSVNTATWLPTDNVKVLAAGGTVTLAGNTTVNTLNVGPYTASSTIALNGNTLTLGNGTLSGGLMFETGTDATVATLSGGTVTAGTTTSPADLYLYFLPYSDTTTARTATVSATIANNTAGGPVRLVYNGSDFATNLLTLQGSNTYTGGTVINAGMLVLGASGTLPAGGSGITINGALSYNGGNASGLTQTAGGTIANQAVTLNGPATLTLAGNNTLTSITYNNSGGTVAPAVTTGGTLTLPGNGITASSSNPATTATLGGTINYGGSAATITVNPIIVSGNAVAPLQATLNVTAPFINTSGLTVAGGGNLQLSAANTFAGGVTVNTTAGSTGLIIGASSTPSAFGVPVINGPLGTGPLTLQSNAVLISGGAFTLGNNVSLAGNLTFNGASNNLTLNGSVTLPTNGTSTITVAAPQVTLTLGGVISGAGASINQSGYGTLILGTAPALNSVTPLGANTFTGGYTINSGVAEGLNGAPFGTGPLTVNGGEVNLLNNMGGEFNNNVTITSAAAFFNVNTNGVAPLAAPNGETFLFGTLTQAGSTVVNVTGGNYSKLAFTGTVNLTSPARRSTTSPPA